VIAQGLLLTGASARVGELLSRAGGSSEKRLVASVMVSGGFLAIFMTNVASTSILMPAVSSLAHRKKVFASKLLMPLAFGTLLGGAATLFTTVNLIVSGSLHDHGLQGYGVLDFAPVGIPAAAVGILWVSVWGRRLLPRTRRRAARRRALPEPDLAGRVYNLSERLFRAPPGPSLDGRRCPQAFLALSVGASSRSNQDRTHLAPPETVSARARARAGGSQEGLGEASTLSRDAPRAAQGKATSVEEIGSRRSSQPALALTPELTLGDGSAQVRVRRSRRREGRPS
jgi:hypothetical protein